MTIDVQHYFDQRRSDRKKEPRYLAVINKDSCTSCNACATVCPVDCIYEVVGDAPSESFHQIDTSRCIGCQLCYRIPSESTDRFNLELCPWNAIDMLRNPNVDASASVLEPYYLGERNGLAWPKLEEYGYQFFLDGEVYLPTEADDLQAALAHFERTVWYYTEERRCRLIDEVDRSDRRIHYRATPEGRSVFDAAFAAYSKLFLD